MVLRNEKYIGDALLQKTYTVDFLTKKQIKNNGIVLQYYVENDHESRRVHWNNCGKKSIVWRCVNTGPFCDARTVPEPEIEQVLVAAINRTLCQKDDFLTVLQQNIETVLRDEKGSHLPILTKGWLNCRRSF